MVWTEWTEWTEWGVTDLLGYFWAFFYTLYVYFMKIGFLIQSG